MHFKKKKFIKYNKFRVSYNKEYGISNYTLKKIVKKN